MIEYLTHYYKKGSMPFRSLSALPESEALKIMEGLSDDSPLFARFKTPMQYMETRRETEQWLRYRFMEKGGRPTEAYPLYAVLGRSSWIENHTSNMDMTQIQIPITIFHEREISFTYPDSMVSHWLGKDQPPEHYQPEYHGVIFTLSEAQSLINQLGWPEGRWNKSLPEEVAPYLEAQIWNHNVLREFVDRS